MFFTIKNILNKIHKNATVKTLNNSFFFRLIKSPLDIGRIIKAPRISGIQIPIGAMAKIGAESNAIQKKMLLK